MRMRKSIKRYVTVLELIDSHHDVRSRTILATVDLYYPTGPFDAIFVSNDWKNCEDFAKWNNNNNRPPACIQPRLWDRKQPIKYSWPYTRFLNKGMENVSYCTIHVLVQLLDFWIAVAIMDMDTDPGSSGVSTLATKETNRARQKQRFESETPEEREDRLTRQRACRRERIASETAEQRETRFTADRARRKRRITSESARQRYASLDAALEVLSKLLRSTIRLYATEKSARRH